MKYDDMTKEKLITEIIKLNGKVSELETSAARLKNEIAELLHNEPNQGLQINKQTKIQLEQEIAERQRAEKALQEQLSFLQTLIDTIPNPIFYKDINGLYQGCNKAFEEHIGYTKEQLSGKTVYDINPKDLADIYFEKDRALFDKPGIQCYETYFLYADGIRHDVILNKATYSSIDGTVAGLAGVIIDITERKRAEEALQNERKRLFSLLDNLPAFVYLQAPDYSIRFANRYYRDHFGEPGCRHCYEINEEQKEPCATCHSFTVFETQRPESWEWNRFDGRTYQVHNYPFWDTDGSPLVLVMGIDITELRQLQNDLARLDRLNLVGEMAASIGHEIRNPMTTVRGFLQMLSSKQDCFKYKDYYRLMIEELDRANSIITEYLSLAKSKTVDLEAYNLNTILEALEPLITATAMNCEKHVIMKLNEIPPLCLNEKEIRQLILNLVHNGLEAMPPGGTLKIGTFPDGEDIVLSVQDQGKGIQPEILEKLGTPFLTTKDSGTGLGLAVCYSIAARHGASIQVNTNPSGTIFFVRFRQRQVF